MIFSTERRGPTACGPKATKGKAVARPDSPRGSARERVIEAAVALFAENGFNGTSLQMIADKLGVSKAAVYYQFHSKDEIALAVVRPVFEDLARLTRIAEAIASPETQRDIAVSGLIELAVRRRGTTSIFHGDPAVADLIRSESEFVGIVDRLRELLVGQEPDTAGRVAISMLTGGIYGAAMDPELSAIDDVDLHRALLECCQQLLRGVVAPKP